MYEIHGRRLGVRWSRTGLDGELRALADSARGVQPAPPNVSIVLGEDRGATRSKHQVHVQGKLLSVLAGQGALVRTVVRALGSLATIPPPGSLSLDAVLVLDSGGGACVVDGRLSPQIHQLEPLLRRRGRTVLRSSRLHVWPARGTVVLPDAAAAVGVSVAELDARWPLQPGDDDLAAGEVALNRLIYAGPESTSRVDTLAAAVPMVRDGAGRLDRVAVAALATFIGHIETGGVSGDPSRLAALLGVS